MPPAATTKKTVSGVRRMPGGNGRWWVEARMIGSRARGGNQSRAQAAELAGMRGEGADMKLRR